MKTYSRKTLLINGAHCHKTNKNSSSTEPRRKGYFITQVSQVTRRLWVKMPISNWVYFPPDKTMVDSTNKKAIFEILEKKLAKYKKKWGDVFLWLPPPFYVWIAKFNLNFKMVQISTTIKNDMSRSSSKCPNFFNMGTTPPLKIIRQSWI